MYRFTKSITFLVAIIGIATLSFSCKKDSLPKASIYVLDQDQNPVIDVDVRFFSKDLNIQSNGLDTTIKTNDKGIAMLELANEAYLDIRILYINAQNGYSLAESNANFIANEHFVDTLVIFKPYVK